MVALTRRKQANGGSRTSRITMRVADLKEHRSTGRSRGSFEREFRKLERLCDSLRESAEQSAQARAELLSLLSHDLRNPLSVILVSTRMLARAVSPEQPGRRHVDAITRAADEINHMLQDFSDSAKIESGRLSIGHETLDVRPIIEQAMGTIRPLAEAKSITITIDCEPDVPRVVGDRERLLKVISNLVTNAIKFTPKGGTIVVRAEAEEEGALLSVTDSGPGISEDQRAYLFMRPGGSRRPVTQGSGLPLYVAKGIVEAHGGRIWVESRMGHGTTMLFTLPAALADGAVDPLGGAVQVN